MDSCLICNSVFKDDIDKMLSCGSNNNYVQQWCKERKLNLSLKLIKEHKDHHLKYIEPTEVKLLDSEPIYLKLSQIEDKLAELKQIKLKQATRELVTKQELEEQWSYSLVGFKAKLEAIPNKTALELSSITSISNVENILTKLISEALEELDNRPI